MLSCILHHCPASFNIALKNFVCSCKYNYRDEKFHTFVWNQTLRFVKSDFKFQFRLSAYPPWLFYSMLLSLYTYTVHRVHVNTWFNAAARVLFWSCGFVLIISSHSISDLFIFLQSHPCKLALFASMTVYISGLEPQGQARAQFHRVTKQKILLSKFIC